MAPKLAVLARLPAVRPHARVRSPAFPSASHYGIASGSAPAATPTSAPFRPGRLAIPDVSRDGLSGPVGLGHYLGTIAAFKLVSTGGLYQKPRHPPPH
jgi:hypothetical protein